MEISKLWQEYTESSIETSEDKIRKVEQDIPPEMTVTFDQENGMDMVIINEAQGNFVPMFLI